MLIGVDFDNTIVCYDSLFHAVAVERGLIPVDVPADKKRIRDHLRQRGAEDDWTELQGHVYGRRIDEAPPFPGVLEFFAACGRLGIEVCIISHRTLRPVRGLQVNMHDVARQWLEKHRILGQVFLEETQDRKLKRISQTGCNVFIDDLPEFLMRPDFPGDVQRILFDPHGRRLLGRDVWRVRAWREVLPLIESKLPAAINHVSDRDSVPPGLFILLAAQGVGESITLHRLEGGANNRVYQIDAADRRLLLKWYFSHPDDPRDRLSAEFSFAEFAWQNGIRALPQPLASSRQKGDADLLGGQTVRVPFLALYEYIDGRHLCSSEITSEHIEAALDFYHSLNRHKTQPDARRLGDASEACFSIADHLARLEYRIGILREIDREPPVHSEALQFVVGELVPAWNDAVKFVRSGARRWGLALDSQLADNERCLSPSDFGFHNAIVDGAGMVRFIDFEYAGWDDPAKMVCDFFCQVKTPIPREHFSTFVNSVTEADAKPEILRRRIQLLFPVHQLKWCCILLNEFLPTASARRQFSRAEHDEIHRKELQLEKSRQALAIFRNAECGDNHECATP